MPRTVTLSALTAIAAVALASTALPGAAHEWNSPTGANPHVRTPEPWSGRLWAGPASGAPPMPQAEDCHRPPAAFDLPGPLSQRQALGRTAPHGGKRAPLDARDALADAETREHADAARAKSAARAARAAETERRAMASEDVAVAPPPPPPAPMAAPAPSSRLMAPEPTPEPAPAGIADLRRQVPAEPVTAGVVDDNADFGAYLAFRDRHRALDVRGRDVSERYRLSVQDRAGRPVPDADVRLYAAGRAQPLWARTDAGGQVWLHPRVAGLSGDVFEVRVSQAGPDGTLQGRAYLRRGQRDALQITLDGEAALPPARLDLVFLVDATGSMADEIGKLRASMQSIADQIAALPSRPSTCYGLVAYRDRGDAFFVRGQDFTDDLAAFQQGLAGLHADGGGDEPEAMDEALHTAVHRLSWRGGGATRLVVLVADAPPHLDYGSPWYDEDMQGALARGIKLMPIGASGLNRQGELVFRQIAQYTGGRFVFLTYADARRPSSGPGRETVHEVEQYSVESLDRLVVRLVREELARRPS